MSDTPHTSAIDGPGGITGRLDGEVALVTGGGSGIGLACARALVADGAAVVLAGRSAERLASGRDELLAARPGAAVHTVICDVTDEDAVADACSTTAAHGAFTMVVGDTGDIARLVRFLLGAESGWITGTCISADGGHHLRRGPNLDPVMRMVLGDIVDP